MQLDLFDHRTVGMIKARAYLARGSIAEARHELVRLSGRGSDDPDVGRELPWEADPARARDRAVAELPDVARSELAGVPDVTAWLAPLGVINGVLPPFALPFDETQQSMARTPPETNSLSAARAFFRALRRATSRDTTVDARRGMRRLSPELFALFMERL